MSPWHWATLKFTRFWHTVDWGHYCPDNDLIYRGFGGIETITLLWADCTTKLRPCPHIPQQSFFPLQYSLASFKNICVYTNPFVNDSISSSLYSSPIGATVFPAKIHQKWRRDVALYIDEKRRNRTQQKNDENVSSKKPESFVWTDNEVKLLRLDYKARKLQEDVDWELCQSK